MTILDAVQGSIDWIQARKGIITGTKAKYVYKSDNLQLIDELIAEVTSEQQDDEIEYQSMDMLWGVANEQFAKDAYENERFYKPINVGLAISDTHPFIGMSFDALIKGKNNKFIGALEIKCPKSKTHCKYIRMGKLPIEHIDQVLHGFLVCEEIEWVDFISYDPRNKIHKMWIFRTYRKDVIEILKENEIEILKFRKKWEKYLNEFMKK